jgi:hypothetical protein|eukprot:19693-Heterococcus_DN1.PRE.1
MAAASMRGSFNCVHSTCCCEISMRLLSSDLQVASTTTVAATATATATLLLLLLLLLLLR